MAAPAQNKCCLEPPLDEASIRKQLAELSPQWTRTDALLVWRFTCRNWKAAIDFIAQCGAVAEALGHHPDLSLTRYREVEVSITTHSLGALTQLDFTLAKQLEAIVIDFSPKWLKENPRSLT